MRVLAQGLKGFPRGSFEDASGFTVSAPASDRVLLEWGDGRWAEVCESPALDIIGMIQQHHRTVLRLLGFRHGVGEIAMTVDMQITLVPDL